MKISKIKQERTKKEHLNKLKSGWIGCAAYVNINWSFTPQVPNFSH